MTGQAGRRPAYFPWFVAPAAVTAVVLAAAMAALLQYAFRQHVPGSLQVGGFTLEADGALALFRVDDLVRLSDDGRCTRFVTFKDEGSERFNDVTADPRGRVFAGTIGRSETSGGVFRYDPDGSSRLLFRGTG